MDALEVGVLHLYARHDVDIKPVCLWLEDVKFNPMLVLIMYARYDMIIKFA